MEIEIDSASLAPGQSVKGTARTGRPGLQHVRVGLLFREESGGWEVTISQVLAEGFEDARDYPEGAELPFAIEVPGDALPSVRGRHGGLFWEVVARTDRVGSRGTASRRVEVKASSRRLE
jgi:hypothetical protein